MKPTIAVSFIKLPVGRTGFEPATPWSQTTYSTGLNYLPFFALKDGKDIRIQLKIRMKCYLLLFRKNGNFFMSLRHVWQEYLKKINGNLCRSFPLILKFDFAVLPFYRGRFFELQRIFFLL